LVKAVEIIDKAKRKPQGGSRNPDGTNQHTGKVVKAPNGALTTPSNPRKSSKETAALFGVSARTVDRARVIYDDPEAMAEVEQGVSIGQASERAQDRKRARAPKAAPREPMKPPDGEVWFRAKTLGSMTATKLEIIEHHLRGELARLAGDGICVAELMGDRRVSREWSAAALGGALSQANGVAAFIRQVITSDAVVIDRVPRDVQDIERRLHDVTQRVHLLRSQQASGRIALVPVLGVEEGEEFAGTLRALGNELIGFANEIWVETEAAQET